MARKRREETCSSNPVHTIDQVMWVCAKKSSSSLYLQCCHHTLVKTTINKPWWTLSTEGTSGNDVTHEKINKPADVSWNHVFPWQRIIWLGLLVFNWMNVAIPQTFLNFHNISHLDLSNKPYRYLTIQLHCSSSEGTVLGVLVAELDTVGPC